MSEDKKPQKHNYEVKPITLQEANNISQTSNGSYNNDYVKMYNTFKAYLEASKVVEELKQENARLTNTIESLKSENKMFVETLERINKDEFIADYQSELNRIIKLAREALGVK